MWTECVLMWVQVADSESEDVFKEVLNYFYSQSPNASSHNL